MTPTIDDFVFLREIVRLLDDDPIGGVRSTDVARALPELSEDDIQRAAVNLERAHLVTISGASGRRFMRATNVSERALRLTGLWPDEEAAADHLLWVLEQKIKDATTADDRSRWTKIRDAIGSAGRDFAVEITAAVAARSIGA